MRLTSKKIELSARRGVAVTEFLIVFPTFLIFSMFIIEVSLMWADRHVLKLAAFEAARTLITEAQLTEASEACWPLDPSDEESKKHRDRLVSMAKTAAVNKVAIIAPSITYFGSQLPVLGQAVSKVDAALDIGDNRYLDSFRKFVLAWPMAWAMTTTYCQEDANFVTLKLRYQRAPRMPYVGGLLWSIKATKKLNQVANGAVTFDIDDLDYFGVHANLNTADVVAKIESARTDLKDTINIVKGMDWEELTADGGPMSGLVSAEILDSTFKIDNKIDKYADTALGLVDQARSIVQKASPLVTALIYAVPENLRLIPMETEIKLSKGLPGNVHEKWHGRAFMVSPLTTENDSAWNRWTDNMQEVANDL